MRRYGADATDAPPLNISSRGNDTGSTTITLLFRVMAVTTILYGSGTVLQDRGMLMTMDYSPFGPIMIRSE